MTDSALPRYARVQQEFPDWYEDRHLPGPDADETFIENWFCTWYDPVQRAGGFHHAGFRWVEGYVDVWNWMVYDGRVVAKYQDLYLPLPGDDFDITDFRAGNLHAGTTEKFRRYFLDTSFPARGGRPEATLTGEFAAFTNPFALSLNTEVVEMASHHYESMGRFSGEMCVDGTPHPVSGYAFKDHSWGPRDYDSVAAHRWVWAVFGEDLFVSSYTVTSRTDSRQFGYVFDDGEFRRVVSMDANVRMEDDGLRPRGCHSRLWTADGRGYQVEGAVTAASPSSHTSGFWIVDGFAEFTMGGRRGTGILETSQLRALTPEWRRDLMLPADAACS